MLTLAHRASCRLVVVLSILLAVIGACPATLQATGSMDLGASYDSTQSNISFRVYSSRATRLEVWIYSQPSGAQEKAHFVMTKDTSNNFWSKTVSVSALQTRYGVPGPVYYGYRAWGPNWPYKKSWRKGSTAGFITDVDGNGNRFNPNKLLIDPYALEISQDPRTPTQADGAIYGSGPNHRAVDTGAKAPKGIVLKPDTVSTGNNPTRPFKDEIIYEVHLRGLTMNDTAIAVPERGTFKGAGQKAAYLKSLGLTAVEFLPVQETENDTNDVEASTTGDNYWGYMTLNYFPPDRRYAFDKSAGGPTKEWKAMVKAFHDQGMKVYIDVVYNHTGEGGTWDSTGDAANLLCWRGLDNPTYYELTLGNRFYFDNTGVGGNFNTANPMARNLIIDSLAYWKDTLGVDGFRFDLASVLGNRCADSCFSFDKLDPANVLNRAVKELPVRPATGGVGVDLIAEPWAIGDGTYQVGNFPSGWAEWNGIYRDTFRKSQNKLGVETITPGNLATRLAGSADLYGDDGRKPWHSVNFMVAHDGFTLRDLYSYNAKNNSQPWPLGPSDGGEDNNNSWDQGGDTTLQRQAARNGLALLMLSAGVPMITGGDEMYRTQNGNNNAYNLDSEKNWLNSADATAFPNFFNYSRKLMAFRNAHPALRPAEFFKGSDSNGNGLKDITWLTDGAGEANPAYMDSGDNHFLAYRIDGSELGDSFQSIYVAYNGWSGELTATLPANLAGKHWNRVSDTASWMEGRDNFNSPGDEELMEGSSYKLAGRSLLILVEK
jgi:isoamylase